MSILTKEERAELRADIKRGGAAFQFDGEDMAQALNTIDALEAERDALKAEMLEIREVVERFRLEGDDEEDIPGSITNLWLAYEGAGHNAGKLRKKLADAEAERDNFGDLFERVSAYANRLVSEERGKRGEIEIDLILLRQQIARIKAIARANHDTTTIGGAHAALREILAVIEGSDEEGER